MSVIRSLNEVTIIVWSSDILNVSICLKNAGICVFDIGIYGRYYTPEYRGILDKVLKACKE